MLMLTPETVVFDLFAGIGNMDWGDIAAWVSAILAVIIGVVGGITWVFKKVFNLGKVSQRLTTVETEVKAIKKDISDSTAALTKRIDDVLVVVAQKGLSASSSPRQLTEEGHKVLESSGIDTIVNDKFDGIVEQVKARDPQNPYQAEQAVQSVVGELVNDPVLKDAIEEGAFRSGYLVPSVLFVGGLYIRDRVLDALGMRVDDIDQHDPNNGKA